MGKKKVEHVVFDGMRKVKKQLPIVKINRISKSDKRRGTP